MSPTELLHSLHLPHHFRLLSLRHTLKTHTNFLSPHLFIFSHTRTHMGKASRWFRGLLGLKSADQSRTHSHQKKKWGFVKSHDGERKLDPRSPLPHAGDDEASRHAIAVATATAAVAEAAVAAAQAAAAVVQLTSSGRGISTVGRRGGGYAIREDWAAVTVQSHFRAYLFSSSDSESASNDAVPFRKLGHLNFTSRRALRALKALVKLQALVRGHLVRKQTACALRRLQALVRAQARIRAGRVLNSDSPHSSMKSSHFNHLGPATPEKFERVTRARSMKHEQLTMLKRNNSKPNSIIMNHDLEKSYTNRIRLDTRMSERSSSEQGSLATRSYHPHTDDDKSAKILEVDSQNCRSFSTTSKDSSTARCLYGLSLSSGEAQSLSPLKFQHNTVDESAFCTANNSPAFYSASSSRKGAFTPTESDGSRSCFSNYSDHPNYMAYTESSKAKARSLSAPRQRTQMERSSSAKRYSVLGSTQRVSGLHANFTSKAYPGSGRLDRLGMPVREEVGGHWHRY